MSRLSELAKLHRLAYRETQKQYARRFGFESGTAVSLWEAGKRKVPQTVTEAIVEGVLPRYVVCEHCHGAGIVHIGPAPKPQQGEQQ